MPTQGFTPMMSSMHHMAVMAKKRNPAGVSIALTICPTVRLTNWAG